LSTKLADQLMSCEQTNWLEKIALRICHKCQNKNGPLALWEEKQTGRDIGLAWIK